MEDRYLEDNWRAKQKTYDMAMWLMKKEHLTWAKTLEVMDRLNEEGLLDLIFTNYYEEKQFERDREKLKEKNNEE
jgi:hypothetical protein